MTYYVSIERLNPTRLLIGTPLTKKSQWAVVSTD